MTTFGILNMSRMIKWFRHGWYIDIYHFLFGHKLTGQNLAHVDPSAYPLCEICGAKPTENFRFYWWHRKHIDIRNRLLNQ